MRNSMNLKLLSAQYSKFSLSVYVRENLSSEFNNHKDICKIVMANYFSIVKLESKNFL